MRKLLTSLAAAGLIAGATMAEETPEVDNSETATETDPYIWLEEVEGEEALAWVEGQNARSLDILKADPRYKGFEAAALEALTSDERITYGSIRDGQVYNFWQDETNVRGLWRRTSLESYSSNSPEWETVIDFDALSEAEDANWVYKGTSCLDLKGQPVTRCMVSLSDGGKDAIIRREFDLSTKTWVEGGFETPEAKQSWAWIDEDNVLIGTDWGGDGSTLTESGYASVIKHWKRGTPLEEAVTVFEGDKTDVAASPFGFELEDGTVIPGIVESDTFFTAKFFLMTEENELVRLPIPDMAGPSGMYEGQMLVSLRQDWTPEGQDTEFKSGDLVSFDFATYRETGSLPEVELVFSANERQSFEGVSRIGETAVLSINDNVVGKLLKLERTDGAWATSPIELPGPGQARLTFASDRTDTAFINYEGFLTPDSLLSYNATTGEMKTLQSLPAKFDAEGLTVQQFEATSADGTKVPYFIVHRADIELDGTTPTLLYGYGGFQISLTPSYSATIGRLWLEQGGAYVLANIRGGGEFGPAWHQAGLKLNRQRIYDDFIAVGEDIVEKGVTSPDHLGIMGGSNGGLLMGVMLNQRPDLWNAVVVQVPLLDMLRYHLLLAGASWVGEYGSPDIPEERAFLETISPYQNFDADADYPTPFFVTSTKDDRVHPGHARKMAKLFEAAGKPFLYYENTDGGHAAAADQTARAKRSALEFTYLARQLFPAPEAPSAKPTGS